MDKALQICNGRWIAMGSLLSLLTLAGCGGSSSTPSEREVYSTRMGGLAILLGNFEATHMGQLPKDEAEFRSFVSSNGDGTAEQLKTTTDDLFVSELDSQPFVLCFGKDARNFRQAKLLAFEQTAVDGQRLVLMQGGTAMFVPESEFASSN